MENLTKRSVCPYDCPDTCGLVVEVVGDRAIRVSGDPEHPYTRGMLCPKMLHYEKTVHSPLRLTTPLKRNGAKGSGSFTPISWDEAIAEIKGRWQEIIDKYGAEAILPYSYAGTMGLIQRNSGHPFFHRLGASRLARTICSPAKEAGWQAVMGDTVAPPPQTVEESDLVLLWGIDAAATSIHFLRSVQTARKKGARVWFINTYESPTAAAADQVILIRPGSDGALALGLMHILARDNLLDHEFINNHVQGFQELNDQVLADYSPAEASRITGLTTEMIERTAAAYGNARAPYIRLGSGLSRYGNGAMTIRTIACLPALTGSYGKTGGGCFPGTSTGPAFAMQAVTREDFMDHPTRIINMNRLGHTLNDLNDPPVMGLYVYHSNPAAVTPDQNAVLKGLARDDLFTVVHERFMTDTARHADIVLPATSSLEHSDLYRSYGTYYIQRAQAAIPAVGQSKSNWEVFGLLAEAMAFDEDFFRQSADELIDHLLSIQTAMREGIDPEALAAGRAVQLCLPARDSFRCQTRSGKIEILNPRQQPALPCYSPPHGDQDPFPFRLMTAPNLFALNASFYEQEDLRRRQGQMFLQMNPLDAKEKGLQDGKKVVVWKNLGEVTFILRATDKVPSGVLLRKESGGLPTRRVHGR